MTAPPDIFLSYNREDQPTARRFAEAFERQGFNVWWDATLRSGEAYDQVTEKALKTAKAVVVLWSKHSAESRWVRAEATLADRNKTLVPAMIEPCDRPIMFELTQTADLTHWQGAASDAAWLAFLSDVRRFVEREPGPATCGVVTTPPSATSALIGERGDVPSLAVLPFANRSGLPEDEVFAFGMVEDIIVALSQGTFVRVLAGTATARFRTSAMPDLDAISRQLGVRYVLEGNVRRTGASLRVTAQLVDAVTGAVLWTQRFDRPLSDLASLQEELVLEVAAHLNAQVQHTEMERALKKPSDLTAWEAVMRALAAIRLVKIANISVWVEEARKAVAIAPDYAVAHAMLAMATALQYFAISPDDAVELRKIRDHIDRALVLDPANPVVLTWVSLALSYIGDPEDGLRHGEHAVRLTPRADAVRFSCGVACVLVGRPEEALAHLEGDLNVSPGAMNNVNNFFWQGLAHLLARRRADSVAAWDRSLALNPAYPTVLIAKAAVYEWEGRRDEAHDLWVRALRAEPAGTLAVWRMVFSRLLARSPQPAARSPQPAARCASDSSSTCFRSGPRASPPRDGPR
ncbi:MAG: TIR domain-containing protein [Steroidobacteraceae bacterium]